MNTLESIIKKAKLTKRRIVLSEGEDPRVVKAAMRAKKMLLAEPILIGKEDNIGHQISSFGGDPKTFQIINPSGSAYLDKYADEYAVLRKNRIISVQEARVKILEPLNFAAMMVRMRDADGTIGFAGNIATASHCTAAANATTGLFLMNPKVTITIAN